MGKYRIIFCPMICSKLSVLSSRTAIPYIVLLSPLYRKEQQTNCRLRGGCFVMACPFKVMACPFKPVALLLGAGNTLNPPTVARCRLQRFPARNPKQAGYSKPTISNNWKDRTRHGHKGHGQSTFRRQDYRHNLEAA